jgi:hypothetical protein
MATGNELRDLHKGISQSTGSLFPSVATYRKESVDLHYEVKYYSV